MRGHRSSHDGLCDRASGCMYTIHEESSYEAGPAIQPQLEDEDDDNADGDSDFVYQGSDDDDEPLEYDSEFEGTIDDPDNEPDNSAPDGSHDFWVRALRVLTRRPRSPNNDQSMQTWYYTGSNPSNATSFQTSVRDTMRPLYSSTDSMAASERVDDVPSYVREAYAGIAYDKDLRQKVEHIAGPGCVLRSAYNGCKISAEEMRGCMTAQCLVRKQKGLQYRPASDDEPFETNGDFFLSGLNDFMPSRDWSWPQTIPTRHGCDEVRAENKIWETEIAEEYAMPFHPSCLEVYKRASQQVMGSPDIAGLTSWWTLEAEHQYFSSFPRDLNVVRCAQQDWRHHNGTEYLVANPLFVTSLPAIWDEATDVRGDFNPRHGAFAAVKPPATQDAFAKLPRELSLLILSQLSSNDIASIRLASRSFQQLPISFFHSLILREMPWLWEAWKIPPGSYSHWACLGSDEIGHAIQQRDLAILDVRDYVRIVGEELPELKERLREYQIPLEREAEAQLQHALKKAESVPHHLPQGKTNWFRLYTLITRHWSSLKGLQNRRRIWKDCQELLRRVEAYRAEGKIPITMEVQHIVLANRASEEARHQAYQDEHCRRYGEIHEKYGHY